MDLPSEITLERFEQLEDTVEKIVRRIDTIQKSLDLINKDRNLLEDILSALRAVKEALSFTRDHIDLRASEMKSDVGVFGTKMEEKIGELADNVGDAITPVVQPTGKLPVKKKSWWKRLLRRG